MTPPVLRSLAALAVAALALPGCAALARAARERELLDSLTEAKVYDQPLDQIWPKVREFAFLRGFAVKSGDAQAGYTVETEWRQDQGVQTRLLLQGVRVDDARSRVVISRQTRRRSGQELVEGAERALDLEWQFWQTADPDGAAAAQAQAERRAEEENP